MNIPFLDGLASLLTRFPDTAQWRERKQRPTSRGDNKNRPKPLKRPWDKKEGRV